MVPNGSQWFPMVPNGSQWFPMVPLKALLQLIDLLRCTHVGKPNLRKDHPSDPSDPSDPSGSSSTPNTHGNKKFVSGLDRKCEK